MCIFIISLMRLCQGGTLIRRGKREKVAESRSQGVFIAASVGIRRSLFLSCGPSRAGGGGLRFPSFASRVSLREHEVLFGRYAPSRGLKNRRGHKS
jgi:hypothetical protein